MGHRSVVTFIGTRRDDREHFPLGPRKRRLGLDRRDIEIEHRLQGGCVLALHFEDLVDPPGALVCGGVDFGELPLGLRLFDEFDKRHFLVCD